MKSVVICSKERTKWRPLSRSMEGWVTLMKVLGRAGDLHKCPGKASTLLQTFLKGRAFSCHTTQRKGPVESAYLCEGLGRTEYLYKDNEKAHTLPKTFPKV